MCRGKPIRILAKPKPKPDHRHGTRSAIEHYSGSQTLLRVTDQPAPEALVLFLLHCILPFKETPKSNRSEPPLLENPT